MNTNTHHNSRDSGPSDRLASGAGFAPVNTTVSCVLTRFRLRSIWSLLPFYIGFRRVQREARKIGGLLVSSFFIEDLHTCYTFSLWADENAIVDFGTNVRSHVAAANSSFSHVQWDSHNKPEVWSAQFRLWAVSAHNRNWKGLDLETLLADRFVPQEEYE